MPSDFLKSLKSKKNFLIEIIKTFQEGIYAKLSPVERHVLDNHIFRSNEGQFNKTYKEFVMRRINKVLDVIKGDLATIRTGRATPLLVESLVISVYGGSTKLKVMELATVGATDANTLVLTPFESIWYAEIIKLRFSYNFNIKRFRGQ